MGDIIFYIAAFIFVIALILVGAWLWKSMMVGGASAGGGLFGGGRDKRIGFVEAASIDGKRKLVLVRRDDVEHLILTGGPVDVVIETGIIQRSPSPEAFSDTARINERIFTARPQEERPTPELND